MFKSFSYIIGVMCLFTLISCSNKDNPSANGTITGSTLQAFKLTNNADAPDYSSSTVEPIWNSAEALSVSASPIGDNFSGSTTPIEATIRSLVSSDNIYFLIQYADADENLLAQPLLFKGGDPQDPINWTQEITAYDDGISLIFEMVAGSTGTKTFSSDGCAMLCHSSEKDFGGGLIVPPSMYTESAGRYDLWHWHAAKSNGCEYADDKISIGIPNYGIKADDENAEIYDNNVISYHPGYVPSLVAGGSNRNLNKQLFIAEETAQNFSNVSKNPATGSTWKANDRVPSSSLASADPSNDNFDIHAKGFYSGGKWTVKFQRKLTEGNANNDIRFAHGNEYLFSLAIHNNNSPGNHYGAENKVFKLKIP
jgi:hypothetical protein